MFIDCDIINHYVIEVNDDEEIKELLSMSNDKLSEAIVNSCAETDGSYGEIFNCGESKLNICMYEEMDEEDKILREENDIYF